MKTIKLSLLLSLFVLLFISSSCVDELFLEGNGTLQSESRGASGFEEIASSGDFDVTIVPGSSYSVDVSAESNLLSYIETDVVGKTLKIRTRGLHSFRTHEPIEIFITTPVLNGLSLSGSGIIKTGSFLSDDFSIAISGSGDIDTDVSTDKMKVIVSGSGNVFLEGDATDSEFVISGSGRIKAYNFPHFNCEAVISGSGDVFVNASESILARISGSGRMLYINNPVIHASISGSGRVIDKN